MTSGIHEADQIYYDMLVDSFGTTTETSVTDTTASGTEIQVTNNAADDIELVWVSGRTPAGGFTLTSLTAINMWFHESSMNANCGGRIRLFRRETNGTETELAGGPFNDGVEFGTVAAQMDWTANPTDTAFAEDERLVLKVYLTNVGAMGGGFTCTLTFNGASGATGDSLITLNETVAFKANDVGTDEVLLLHCNGTDGSTTFTDSSARAHTLTVNADVQLDTAQSKFGTASALFDGTADFLSFTNETADFDFNRDDFTIDFWVRLAATGAQYNLWDSNASMGGGTGAVCPVVIYISTNNQVNFFTLGVNQISGTTFLTFSRWYHVALTRSGSSTRLFLDGVQEGSTYTDNNNYGCGRGGSGPRTPSIGGASTGDLVLNGWMDEIHVVRGEAVWTANFTPPASEYPIAAATSLVFIPNAYLKPLLVR